MNTKRRTRLEPELSRLTGFRAGWSPITHSQPRHRPQSAPLVAAQGESGMRPTLLLGRKRLAEHPDTPVPVYLLDVSEEHWESISRFDWQDPIRPSDMARAARALWEAGLRSSQIGKVLCLDGSVTKLHRITTAGKLSDYALSMLDKGAMSWAHARLIWKLTTVEQDRHVGDLVARKLSFKAFEQQLKQRTHPAPSADMAKYERLLQQALQSNDTALVARGQGKYLLEIQWSLATALQGVLERLASAPTVEDEALLPKRLRKITIELDSDRELDALCGHLVGEL